TRLKYPRRPHRAKHLPRSWTAEISAKCPRCRKRQRLCPPHSATKHPRLLRLRLNSPRQRRQNRPVRLGLWSQTSFHLSRKALHLRKQKPKKRRRLRSCRRRQPALRAQNRRRNLSSRQSPARRGIQPIRV